MLAKLQDAYDEFEYYFKVLVFLNELVLPLDFFLTGHKSFLLGMTSLPSRILESIE